jgi:predicted aspartyl protease
MRVDGVWLQCDDGVVRPVLRAEILDGKGDWHAVELLIDTGADRTVLSADILELLDIAPSESSHRIGGVGGIVDSVTINTQIRLTRDDGLTATIRGVYAACTSHEALDMSVLGRDVLDLFALIVDRRTDVIAILGGQHRYTILS